MIIKQLRLKNIRRHRDLTIDFVKGLNGCVGQNGAGKSTITDAIYSAITNDYGRFNSIKDNVVCDTAPLEEASHITLTLSHKDVDYEIFRRLRKGIGDQEGRSNNELVFASEKFSRDPDIRRELEARICSFKILANNVFVAQGRLFEMLSQTSGERALAFQTLCGTLKARKINEAIERFRKTDTSFSNTVIDDGDELRAKIQTLEQMLASSTEEHQKVSQLILSDDRLTSVRRLLSDCNRRTELLAELEETTRQLVELQNTVGASEELLQQWEQYYAAVLAERELAAEAAADAPRRLLVLKAFRDACNRQCELQEKMQTAQQELKKLEETAPPAISSKGIEDLQQSLAIKTDRHKRNKAMLDTFASGKLVECPTCHTPTTNLHKHMKDLPSEQEKLFEEIKELVVSINQIRQAKDQYELHSRKIETARRNFLVAEQALLNLPEPETPPAGDNEANLRKLVEAHVAAKKIAEEAGKSRDDAREAYSADHAAVNSAEARLKLINIKLEGLEVSDVPAEKLSQQLEAHSKASLAAAEINGRISHLRSQIKEEKTTLEALKVRKERAQRMQRFSEELLGVQEVMHHQALPQEVAQLALRDIEEKINANLDQFGSPFWIETSEDLSAVVHFPGEPPRPAEQLSFGQKSVLALAMRQAMLSTFSSDLDLLVLDEPTESLDTANRKYMAEMFTQYASAVRGSAQVIVITHADELQPVFDKLVTVGES